MCLFVVLLVTAGSCAPDRSDEIARLNAEIRQLREIAGPAPAALDSLYPPAAAAPVFLIAMHEMATPLTATLLKVREGDPAGASRYLARFREAYGRASEMVPEWKERFPPAPVGEFAAAVETGNMEKVMTAMQKVGAVCQDCHAVNMAKVQAVREWDDFSVISVTDPRSNRDLSYPEFMMTLDMAFTGIGVGLEEGKIDRAREYFASFSDGMDRLRESCRACHETERAYFVDAGVRSSIDALGGALRNPKPDPQLVGGLMMKIGTESCGKCHLVHVPAAYAQSLARKGNAVESATPHRD